jgi:tetratricopeptide (TPR) repeat protein
MRKDEEDEELLLSRAKEQEKEYDWLGAASSYSNAIEAIPKNNFFRVGQTREACAYASFKAAMQAENIKESKDRLSKSEKQYKKAKQSYAEANSPRSASRIHRCEAMIAYLGFWQTSDVPTKKNKVSEAWSSAKRAMDAFGPDEASEFGKTYNQLFLSAVFCLHFSDNQEFRKTILNETIAYGEKVVTHLLEAENPDELVKALVRVSGLFAGARDFSAASAEERENHIQRHNGYWRKAMSLSEGIALAEKVYADIVSSSSAVSDMRETLQITQKQLDLARKTGDRFLVGATLGTLASLTDWQGRGMEDPAEANVLLDKTLRYVEEARAQFGKIEFVTPDFFTRIWVSSPCQPWYFIAQSNLETDLRRKGELARESLKFARLESVAAEKSGYPYVVAGSHFTMALSLVGLANTEVNKENKARLLEEAIRHRFECLRFDDILGPSDFLVIGVDRCLLGETELEYAEIADSSGVRKASLDSSVSHLREGLGLVQTSFSIDFLSTFLGAGGSSRLSGFLRVYGRALRGSYEMTGARETMVDSATAFEKAAEFDGKADMPSRVAESLWEAARSYDGLGEHLKASERFEEASVQYQKAADKIKSLSQLYHGQSLYMKAWSEIEKAKYHHARQEPASAQERFNKAAELHKSTEKWSFLSTNYFAWAQVENAEDLSQKERCKESIDAFTEASRLFKDSKRTMQEQVAKIDSPDEKQMVERLIDAADNRQELCKARIALEEARLLDKEGKLGSASEKYGLAVDMFAKIKQGLTAEQDRKEIELIITLTKAWKAMAKAESKSSPELYEEAAHLFDEAKDLSPGDKAINLAMGHSRLCMALGAGVRYADNPESTLHATAVKNLESAAKYYLKADLQSAAEYAKASKLLFDSYAHMNRAGSEEDQEKKAKFYTLAEKTLQASATSYDKADQPGKKEQVLKLLAKVQQDKEFAISLTEVFRAPDIVSTTMAFSSPTPTQETAVGLERFEHADIQANLIAPKKELRMDEDLELEIELVNAGRGPAQLIKLQDILPKGFTLREEAGGYRMEDSYLDLRGKRLDALKTEEISLVLKPVHRGQFTLKPRILYLDEGGKYKSHEPEPMKITVGAEAMATADQAVNVDTREAAEARSLLSGLNVVTLSHYRIVGNYVRYGKTVCNELKDARQKIVAACKSPSPKRENYIIWAPPGSGKTYFVQEVAALLGDSVHYSELNLAKLDEAGFRSGLAELRNIQGPSLCLIDEVDSKPDASWPYEALMPFLDASAVEGARLVFVLAGSSGSSLQEMKKAIASRPKGSDILNRVPTDNEYSIPPMGVGDRLLVVLSQFRQAGKQMGHDVREVEKLGLYYVALNPRLSNARQLREFAVRCAERVLPGDDRLKYDSLFRPGDVENKLFWTQALQSAGALVDSFLLVED